MKSFTAGKNEDGARLSRFVENVTSGMPKSLLYKAFRNKRIKVNGKKGAPDTRLCPGDLVELYINDEFFPQRRPRAGPFPIKTPASAHSVRGRKHRRALQARPPAVPFRPHG